MNTPEWLKPGLIGVGVGAVALAITGFTWGGWVTGPKAEVMAANQAKVEVLAARPRADLPRAIETGPAIHGYAGSAEGHQPLSAQRHPDGSRLGDNAGLNRPQ